MSTRLGPCAGVTQGPRTRDMCDRGGVFVTQVTQRRTRAQGRGALTTDDSVVVPQQPRQGCGELRDKPPQPALAPEPNPADAKAPGHPTSVWFECLDKTLTGLPDRG
ncbi:hypothetical protein GCM10022295_69870 [Streptomyces osmaniensis]|uniref:Uncharacterized protein n=1 Tax=Streptomyces osmaniensis TaxID=593134 RepID=A0ABP6Y8F1_9ACTN